MPQGRARTPRAATKTQNSQVINKQINIEEKKKKKERKGRGISAQTFKRVCSLVENKIKTSTARGYNILLSHHHRCQEDEKGNVLIHWIDLL